MVPKAREIIPRSAMVNGASPFTIRVAGTEPTPMNTRKAVPMASAASFWTSGGLVEHGRVLSCSRVLSNAIRYSRTWRGRYACDSRDHKSLRHTCVFVAPVVSEERPDVIQSVDRAIRVLTALQGARRMSLVRARRAPGAGAVDDARHRPHPGGARDGRAGARLEPLPAGTGGAATGQRLPRHARAAVQGDPLGRGPRPSDRLRGPHRGAADRRRGDHPPRATARTGAGRCPRSGS